MGHKLTEAQKQAVKQAYQEYKKSGKSFSERRKLLNTTCKDAFPLINDPKHQNKVKMALYLCLKDKKDENDVIATIEKHPYLGKYVLQDQIVDNKKQETQAKSKKKPFIDGITGIPLPEAGPNAPKKYLMISPSPTQGSGSKYTNNVLLRVVDEESLYKTDKDGNYELDDKGNRKPNLIYDPKNRSHETSPTLVPLDSFDDKEKEFLQQNFSDQQNHTQMAPDVFKNYKEHDQYDKANGLPKNGSLHKVLKECDALANDKTKKDVNLNGIKHEKYQYKNKTVHRNQINDIEFAEWRQQNLSQNRSMPLLQLSFEILLLEEMITLLRIEMLEIELMELKVRMEQMEPIETADMEQLESLTQATQALKVIQVAAIMETVQVLQMVQMINAMTMMRQSAIHNHYDNMQINQPSLRTQTPKFNSDSEYRTSVLIVKNSDIYHNPVNPKQPYQDNDKQLEFDNYPNSKKVVDLDDDGPSQNYTLMNYGMSH